MGQTFANITVTGITQDTLFNYLQKLGRSAYVSPAIDNFVVVYDEEIEADLEELSNLAIISRRILCKTLSCLFLCLAIAR